MAKRRLGQHFLFDPSILRRIVDAAGLAPQDTIIEIGPGHGRLTTLLSGIVSRVIAIEIDEFLCERLKSQFSSVNNVEIICGDALRFPYKDLKEFKVVANIPYYITTPIIFKLLEHKNNLLSMTLTLQKEVAERIVAVPGTKKYGVLSVIIQYYGEPSLKFNISRGAFKPPPEVDSAVVRIDLFKEPRLKAQDEKTFLKVIRTAFGKRRKVLSNALSPLVRRDVKEILTQAGIDPQKRAESLTIAEFVRLSDVIYKLQSPLC